MPPVRYARSSQRTAEEAEDLAAIGIAVVIWASAVFAGYESIRKLIEHGHTTHVAAGIAGAAIGIIGNQVVALYKLVVGKRIGSATLIADARHSWLDALSSAGALVGLLAVALGQPWGDPWPGLRSPRLSASSAGPGCTGLRSSSQVAHT